MRHLPAIIVLLCILSSCSIPTYRAVHLSGLSDEALLTDCLPHFGDSSDDVIKQCGLFHRKTGLNRTIRNVKKDGFCFLYMNQSVFIFTENGNGAGKGAPCVAYCFGSDEEEEDVSGLKGTPPEKTEYTLQWVYFLRVDACQNPL
jgi:hypothetical protein